MRHLYPGTIKHLCLSLTLLLGCFLQLTAQIPADLDGSRKPYPCYTQIEAVPDSFVVVMINHVGRHGSRFPTDQKPYLRVQRLLHEADSLGSVTVRGRALQSLLDRSLAAIDGRWGALDDLGVKEQRTIARKMYETFPAPFLKGRVEAVSSYVPRCVKSMHSFIEGLEDLNDTLQISSASGRQFNALLRPFEVNEEYLAYRREAPYAAALEAFDRRVTPERAAEKILGRKVRLDDAGKRAFLHDVYYVLSSMGASGIADADIASVLDRDEYEALWEYDNLRQYLTRSANPYSEVPAEIARPLLSDLVATTDAYLERGEGSAVQLRFAHAETLYPLTALMEMPRFFCMTADYATLADCWDTWYIAPMAANLQMILLRAPSGLYYLRLDYNGQTIPLAPGLPLYLPWPQARAILSSPLI